MPERVYLQGQDVIARVVPLLRGGDSGQSQRVTQESSAQMVTSDKDRKLQVFLCHASGDKSRIRRLSYLLETHGFDPWLDEEKLLPGVDWASEIAKAIHRSDIVVACLSKDSVTKRGFVQKELRYALDTALELPFGSLYLIPFAAGGMQSP